MLFFYGLEAFLGESVFCSFVCQGPGSQSSSVTVGRRLLRVIVISVWMLLIYRIYGLNKAMDRLKSIRCKDPVRIKNPLSEFLYARRVMVWSQFVVSLLNAGKIDSFLRSLSLCASLKKFGDSGANGVRGKKVTTM